MNFTLTPGVYAALSHLSLSTRRKVLEAAQAYVIAGIEPHNLSKNLTVIFMLVVDSATEGKMNYTPESHSAQNPEDKAVDRTVEMPADVCDESYVNSADFSDLSVSATQPQKCPTDISESHVKQSRLRDSVKIAGKTVAIKRQPHRRHPRRQQ